MRKLLHIEASPMGELSYSTKTAKALTEAFAAASPDHEVVENNLWDGQVPEFDFTAASGKYKIIRGLDHSAEEAEAWKAVTDAVEELKAADALLISTGMWNFSIPYKLKQYLDIIVQPGHTFTVDPEKGYQGLITGKPAVIVAARGGSYPEGTDYAAYDFQVPYLKNILGFIGFTDVRVILVENTLAPEGADSLAAAIREAKAAGAAL